MDRYYFDHNATTPILPAVLDVYTAALKNVPGNASSIHQDGQSARKQLEKARGEVATLLGCRTRDLIFTSGGTEANNLAILGAVRAHRARQKHLITTAIEHPAVLNACAQLEREGVAVTYVNPRRDGVVPAASIRAALRPETVLISVMHANNETGAVQPIHEIGLIARSAGVLFHSDGVQAAGKLPLNLRELGVNLYAISAHKLYAPKGIGTLYIEPGIDIQPLEFGGRHEQGRRPGTENVPAAIAFGFACGLANRMHQIASLRDHFETRILAAIPNAIINAAHTSRLPNTCSLRFDGIEGESLVIAMDLRGFAISSGSACSSGAVEPSHVLTAMGLTASEARSSIRVSLGVSNTEEQVNLLADALIGAVSHLRKLSPSYAAYA